MSDVYLIVSLLVLLFAAYIVVMNWCCVIVTLRNKRRGIDGYHSTVPGVSFLITTVAIGVYPRPDKLWMLAVPLLDIGNWNLLWFLMLLPVMLVRERRSKKSTEGDGSN